MWLRVGTTRAVTSFGVATPTHLDSRRLHLAFSHGVLIINRGTSLTAGYLR